MTRAEFIARWGCAGMETLNGDLERDLDALLEGVWEEAATKVDGMNPKKNGAVVWLRGIPEALDHVATELRAQAIRSGGSNE